MKLNSNTIFARIIRKILSFFKIRIHFGLVFNFDINTIKNLRSLNDGNDSKESFVKINRCNNAKKISEFYIKNNQNIPVEVIENWLLRGYTSWVAYCSDKIVGVSWTWIGEVLLPGLSGRAFSNRKKIIFEENSFYLCHIFVDPHYRGLGIMEKLEIEQLKFHIIKEGYKKGIITMGTDNIPSVKTQTKIGGKLIVVACMILIMNFQFRKLLYSDLKEKRWE